MMVARVHLQWRLDSTRHLWVHLQDNGIPYKLVGTESIDRSRNDSDSQPDFGYLTRNTVVQHVEAPNMSTIL